MLTNTLIFLTVVATTLVVAWLTMRVRHARHPAAKWSGLAAGGLFAFILLVVSGASTRGMWMLYSPHGRLVRDLKVEATPERIIRGQQIANSWCVGCHSMNGELPLSGGKNLSDEAGIPLGDLYTINLTPAGPLAGWTDGEIFRAIRDGADNRGRRLPVMSSQRVRNLSDEDIQAVIAYLRSQPAVQHETPPPKPSFLAVMFAGAGLLPYLPDMAPDTIFAPPRGATLEYGQYTVKWMGCDECHGAQLTGGGGGVLPKGPSLRSVKGWTAEQFIATMRSGKTPFGKQLDSLAMPWKFVGRLSDEELTAMHKYLASLN
jgi:mono/diheme cytochrome c family protein